MPFAKKEAHFYKLEPTTLALEEVKNFSPISHNPRQGESWAVSCPTSSIGNAIPCKIPRYL